MLGKNVILTAAFSLFSIVALAQTQISVSTNISMQRNFGKQQKYWAIGQNVIMEFHFAPADGAYTSISYYALGKFINTLSADAKSPTTTPQQLVFKNNAQMQMREIAMGWKHYFKGNSLMDGGWAIYGIAGFGLVFGKAINSYNTTVDTALYISPERPINGTGHFKRLTLDLGLGWESEIGGNIYLYTDAKVWIPASDYPSKYLFVNKNAPFAGMLGAGIRILF